MNTALLRSLVIGVSAVICSLAIATALDSGLAHFARSSGGDDIGRYVLHRETNEGWIVLDTKAGRVCLAALTAPKRCTY